MTPSYGGLALEIVVPVFNEEAVLEHSISRLSEYLSQEMPSTWKITIADNASTDRTPAIAARLSEQLPNVEYRRLEVSLTTHDRGGITAWDVVLAHAIEVVADQLRTPPAED